MPRGQSLALNRDGTRAVVVSASSTVHFVPTGASGPSTNVKLGPIHDVASVGAQIWVAAGNPARLHRRRR